MRLVGKNIGNLLCNFYCGFLIKTKIRSGLKSQITSGNTEGQKCIVLSLKMELLHTNQTERTPAAVAETNSSCDTEPSLGHERNTVSPTRMAGSL